MKQTIKENWFILLVSAIAALFLVKEVVQGVRGYSSHAVKKDTAAHWMAPSLYTDEELSGPEREQVIYGSELVAHTARYFGPKGTVLQITNGMNCQNCHLSAGAKSWGNNYGAVGSTYPKFRDRSGAVETIPKRVNDCFERSLNGQAIDTNSREMKAIVAYIKWLGKDVKKGTKPKGSGITDLGYLQRAADPASGKQTYIVKCQSCHGVNGEGAFNPAGNEYVYPPLWGEHSYNAGAGLFRLSRFAGYIRDNMPFNQASHSMPALTDEEAWDLAAFVNSQPRPGKDLSKDWPDISKKPVDHPFGPYADGFSEAQHKFGPFQPIVDARKKQKEQKETTSQAQPAK